MLNIVLFLIDDLILDKFIALNSIKSIWIQLQSCLYA